MSTQGDMKCIITFSRALKGHDPLILPAIGCGTVRPAPTGGCSQAQQAPRSRSPNGTLPSTVTIVAGQRSPYHQRLGRAPDRVEPVLTYRCRRSIRRAGLPGQSAQTAAFTSARSCGFDPLRTGDSWQVQSSSSDARAAEVTMTSLSRPSAD
jgi:hypothetical protein